MLALALMLTVQVVLLICGSMLGLRLKEGSRLGVEGSHVLPGPVDLRPASVERIRHEKTLLQADAR